MINGLPNTYRTGARMNISALRKPASLLSLTLVLLLFTGQSAAGMFKNVPDAIVCNIYTANNPDLSGDIVFYLDVRYDDGRVRYVNPGSNVLQLSVDTDGVITAGGLKECEGKTLDEIEKEGRALHFHMGKSL
jgi:hypothetical protein